MCPLPRCLSASLRDAQVQRPDDNEETVHARLVHYNMHVGAVKEAFTQDGDRGRRQARGGGVG